MNPGKDWCEMSIIVEDEFYLLECQRHTAVRTEMINRISRFCTPSLNCILLGDTELNYNNNSYIFLAVQKFILDSKRFQS